MDLKLLKRLPKFNIGDDAQWTGWLNAGYPSDALNPYSSGWNQWTKPGVSVLKGLGKNAYDPSDTRALFYDQLNPNSVLNQKAISLIKVPKEDKPDNSAAGLKAASVIGGVTNIAGGFIGQLSAVKSSDELLANAGQSQGNVMGVWYNKLNDIDEDAEMKAVTASGISNTLSSTATGASAGAAFGPVGAVVGGVVGGITGLIGLATSTHKLRKRMENARLMAQRRNTYNMSGAMTTGLQQDYYSNNASGGLLYANKGKDIRL